MRYKSRTRALASAALAASLGLAGLAFTASPVQASETTDVVRVAGTTRYGTAADAATSAYPAGSANVVLASGEKFPDALAGGGLAGSLDAPILLTQEGALPADTIAALAELDAETVTILGGTDAVSAAVEAELVALGYGTDRVAGLDRFETAADIAAELGNTTAVLANGLRFPDALAISPGAHALGLPVLLTLADSLHEDAAAYIDANAVDTVIIVGGTGVVSQDIEDALEADGITVVRLAGDTRYETSVEIAEFHVTQGFTLDEVVMATGENFADALAGGPYAAQMGAPMVLTQTATLTPATAAFLTENCQTVDALSILGGTAAITADVEAAAAAAAQCATNQSFATSAGTQVVDTGGDAALLPYQATGLTAGADYEIAVFPCGDYGQDASVKADGERYPNRNGESPSDGIFTFRDQDLDGVADDNADTQEDWAEIVWQAPLAAPVAGDQVTATASATGTVDFFVAVDAGEEDCAVPVIWSDADTDGLLDLDTDSIDSWNVPAEPFAVGGAAVFHQGEAPNGNSMEGDVIFVDIDDQFWVDDSGFQFFWGRTGDTYFYDGSEVDALMSQDLFETYLSIGDNTSDDQGTPYARTGNTIFEIETDTPGTPMNVTIEAVDNDDDGNVNDIAVSWAHPDPLEGNDDQGEVYLYDATTFALVTSASTSEVDTLSPNTSETMWVFSDQAVGEYIVRVAIDSETDDEGDESLLSNVAAVEAAPVTAPTITSAALTTDDVVIGEVDQTDVWTLTFSEELALTSDDAGVQITFTDADGDLVLLECGLAAAGDGVTGVSCALGDGADATVANDTLTITFDVEAPEDRNFAGDGNILYPATITDTSGITDLDEGAEVDVSTSADVTVG